MEPSPPLRFHPRGPPAASTAHWELGLANHHQHQQHRQHQHRAAKVSPRHVKLQSVHAAPLSLPAYAHAALRDQIQGQFRHELFQFHQLLQDVVARSRGHAPPPQHGQQLHVEAQTSSAVFELLTGDRHAAVLREFFTQWQRTQLQQQQTPDEQELLSLVVDAVFRNLPTVLTESDARNAKQFTRLLDALHAMRELILSLLYKADDAGRGHHADDDDDGDEGATGAATPSSIFASTAALLSAMGGAALPQSQSQSQQQQQNHTAKTPARQRRRVPLFLYCQQLERELESLRRRHRTLRLGAAHPGRDDVGLLHDQTLALLVQFWELPKRERLAFFFQVASQAKRDDCDMVLQAFLDKCGSDKLLSVWDALQLTPLVQHALAARRHGDDAEAVQALAAASHDVEGRHRRDGSSSGDSSGEDGGHARAKAAAGGGPGRGGGGGHRASQRQVDLSGFAGAFEDDDDEFDGGDDAGGDGWGGGGGKRRRRRLHIRDRGRTPEGQRGRQQQQQQPHHHHHHHGRHSAEKGRHHARQVATSDEDARSRPGSHAGRAAVAPPATPQPVLDRIHSGLLELLKEDDPELDAGITDAAWKLVEVIDRAQRYHSVVPRGPRRLSTFQQHVSVQAAIAAASGGADTKLAGAMAGTAPTRLLTDELTTEQQFVMKVDQLQSLLASLATYSLHAMGNDTIASVYKRVPALQRLFAAFSSKAHDAVGLETPTIAAAATAHHPLPLPLRAASSVAADAAAAAGPPVWADDQVLVILGKLGKMVRSLAPIVDVRSGGGGGGLASAEILKLAEAMEEVASGGERTMTATTNGGTTGRRHLSLDPARRMALLNRLKSLAQGNQIESVTGLLATTCEDLATLRVVSEHQQLQLDGLAASATPAQDNAATSEDDGSGGSQVDNGAGPVNEVLKLVKKAKSRRASAAKLAPGRDDTHAGGDSEDERNDEQSLLLHPMTAPRYANRLDIPLTIKQATAQRGSKLFNAGILLRVVDQMYRESFEAMGASPPQYGSRRMEFSEFMYDWHIRKYGLKALAQQHLLKLIQSLRKHERKVFQCHLCLRFLGIVSPLGFHEHKFVLTLLDKWSAGSFAGAAKHRVECAPQQFKVRVAFAVATLQDALGERFGVYFRTGDAVAARVRAQAIMRDDEFIREAELLTVAIDEWQAQRARLEQILEAVYTAGDLNGDGSLEYDEFSAVLLHLAPSLDDKFIQRVFTAAHDYLKPRRISSARFLDVVLLERVLSTTSAGGGASKTRSGNGNGNGSADRSAAAGSSSSTTSAASSSSSGSAAARLSAEDEEIYQFRLLEETWEHDRDAVLQALGSVTHAATAAAIRFRVTFLTQILSKRVDSKTAWMCHRQIMRDISRYQNLNEEQIVAVKTKEESFKKAVLAIRNLQRLSVAFRAARPAAADTSGGGGGGGDGDGDGDGDGGGGGDGDGSASGVPADAAAAEGETSEAASSRADNITGSGDGASPPPPTHRQASYSSVVEGALSSASRAPSTLAEIAALEDQLRHTFLERADEAAIDDFKHALQTIRRASLQAFPPELELETLRAVHAEGAQRRERASLTFGGVAEEDAEEEGEEEEEDEEEEEEDEEDGDEEEAEFEDAGDDERMGAKVGRSRDGV